MKVGWREGGKRASFRKNQFLLSRRDLVCALWRVIAERLRMQNRMLISSNSRGARMLYLGLLSLFGVLS
jgi:hypothetical protein